MFKTPLSKVLLAGGCCCFLIIPIFFFVVIMLAVISQGISNTTSTYETQDNLQENLNNIPDTENIDIGSTSPIEETKIEEPVPSQITPIVPNSKSQVTPQQESKPVVKSSPSYTCNCSKTCPQMSSCSEAQYQLNTCGCSARDGDNDGVACDSDCQ